MKAHRQITFQKEHRLVWSYTAFLAVAAIFLMMRPVLAQDKEELPDVKLEIHKEYDEQGRLVGADTLRTWTWSGNEFSGKAFDSVWRNLDMDLRDLFPRSFDASGFAGPPLHRFWHWNGEDSTAWSYLEDVFDEDLRRQMEDLEERMEIFRKQYRQQMERYFSEPPSGEGKLPGTRQNGLQPDPTRAGSAKKGKV